MSAPDHFLVKNWTKFQHYKDRNPPWIKLHVEILASEDWVALADASKLLAVVCMVLAARNDGKVPNNIDYIKRVAYLDKRPDLKPLIDCGFLVNPQADASESKQKQALVRPEGETETYSTEAESEQKESFSLRSKDAGGAKFFDEWWAEQPNKVGKPIAKAAYAKALTKATQAQLILGLRTYIAGKPAERQWLNPSTWLNQERWNDQPALVQNNAKPTIEDKRAANKRAILAASGLDNVGTDTAGPIIEEHSVEVYLTALEGPDTGNAAGVRAGDAASGGIRNDVQHAESGPAKPAASLSGTTRSPAERSSAARDTTSDVGNDLGQSNALSSGNSGPRESGTGATPRGAGEGKAGGNTNVGARTAKGPDSAGAVGTTPPAAEDDGLEIPAFLDRRPKQNDADLLRRVLGNGPAAQRTIASLGTGPGTGGNVEGAKD